MFTWTRIRMAVVPYSLMRTYLRIVCKICCTLKYVCCVSCAMILQYLWCTLHLLPELSCWHYWQLSIYLIFLLFHAAGHMIAAACVCRL
uniref:Uncharacterized protein n=1 Tax=Rhipicephalus microplus TaxID=6941 RepID=A0A6G5AHB4_RHIMP